MLAQTIKEALLAHLIGDALGVPYEFHKSEELPEKALIDMVPPGGFDRSHRAAPLHAWSDDGAQMLALVDTLNLKKQFDGQTFAYKLHSWWSTGKYAVAEKVFDYGMTTAAAIERLEAGVPWNEAGGEEEWDNGNGALMRVAPLAFAYSNSEQLVKAAFDSSLVTHRHAISQVCCALYCLTIGELASQAEKDVFLAFESAKAHLEPLLNLKYPDQAQFFSKVLSDLPSKNATMKGCYVVHTLGFALHAAHSSSSFKDALQRAVKFGHDTDTVAAVAGPLAYLKHGKLYGPWLKLLAGQKDALNYLEKFANHFGTPA